MGHPTTSQTFNKSERLTGKKLIDDLFDSGQSFKEGPIRVVYKISPQKVEHHRALVSVPQKLFKRAVDRNLLKRRMREAYRLNKYKLASVKHKLMIAYIYNAKEIESYETIDAAFKLSMEKLLTIKLSA